MEKAYNTIIQYPGYGTLALKEVYAPQQSWLREAEMRTKAWFVQNIKQEWNILDVGAHVGMYALLFAERAFMGNVFCFEPTETIEMLKTNIAAHGGLNNIELLNVAVGASAGSKTEVIQKIWEFETVNKEFPFESVDSFSKSRELKIDLIKIDTDGFDFEVLQGAENVFRTQSPKVVVELNPTALGYRNHTPKEAVEFMKSIGYALTEIMDGENYLFTKKEE